MNLFFLKNKYISYIPKLSFTVFEHVIYSGSNFILNILLARFLTQADYGLFVTVFSIYFFGASIHNAIILEPYSVFFFTKFNETKNQYINNAFFLSTLLGGVLSIIVILFAAGFLLFMNANYFILSIIFSIYMITSFLEITIRRTYYSLKLYKQIFFISTIRIIISIALVFIFHFLNFLNPQTVFIILVIMTVSIFVIGLFYLKNNYKLFKQGFLLKNDILFSHWNFGKWALLTSITHWISNYGYLLIIGYFVSLKELAGFKAVQNIINPLNLFSTAIGTFLITFFSSNMYKGKSWVSMHANRMANLATFGIAIIVLIVYLLHNEIIIFLYGGKYIDYSYLLIYLIFTTILTFRTNVLSMVLRSMEKTRDIFISNLITSISTIVIGVPLIKLLAIEGAAINLIITSFILAITVTIFYKKAIIA